MFVFFETHSHRAMVDNINGTMEAYSKVPRMTGRQDYVVNINDVLTIRNSGMVEIREEFLTYPSGEFLEVLKTAQSLAPNTLKDGEYDAVTNLCLCMKLPFLLNIDKNGYFVLDTDTETKLLLKDGLIKIFEMVSNSAFNAKRLLNPVQRNNLARLIRRLKISDENIVKFANRIIK